MPASNINSVTLGSADGKLTIVGTIADLKDYSVELLHVWLAQPGGPNQNGVGLAIDCINGTKATFDPNKDTFEVIVDPGNTGVVGGPFFSGPAIASAIAVLAPKKSGSEKGVVTEVLQWSLILELAKDQKHVDLVASTEGQGEST